MLIVITGTPGTGKTSIAKKLSKSFNFELINEKEFALINNLGTLNTKKELEIDLIELRKAFLNKLKSKNTKIIAEGHLLSEIKLPADLCIVLKTKPELIEKRLKKRKYSDEKILDNVFCEETNYCLNKAKKNYVYITILDSSDNLSVSFNKILLILKKKNLI